MQCIYNAYSVTGSSETFVLWRVGPRPYENITYGIYNVLPLRYLQPLGSKSFREEILGL
jgi:hypothetical protein